VRAAALALALLLAPAAARAQAVVQVPADAVVDQSPIRIGDISQVEGLEPEIADAISALELGPAAEPARTRALSGRAIAERLHAVDAGIAVDVPDTVRVRTAHREIGQDEIRARLEAAIRHRMPWPARAVEIKAWSLPAPFAVPLQADRLVVRFAPGEDFRGRVAAELEFTSPEDTGASSVRRSASVELDVRLPVAVAAQDLRRGRPLGPDAIALEDRDLRHLPRDVVTDPEQVIGLALVRSIRANTPLRLSYFDTPVLVDRGDVILVDAGGSALDLRLQARAMQAGRLGQVIDVENPSSRRRFALIVTGSGAAKLALGGH